MFGRSLRALLPPVILAALLFFLLREPITWWLYGEQIYDEEAVKEWIREARNTKTLPELAKEYLDLVEHERRVRGRLERGGADSRSAMERELRIAATDTANKREEIEEFLKSIGDPPTKMYSQQLPLFPVIYEIRLSFDEVLGLPPIIWDSERPRQISQYRELLAEPLHPQAWASVEYHLHAYQQRQVKERQEATRRLWLSGLAILFTALTLFWVYLTQRRERRRERQRLLAQQQLNDVERLRLEEELRRQEAERKHEDAERQNLELKSQLFANIGIMAGSYAHNIKNLLVRPNDLLRRCLEEPADGANKQTMLREVKQTLGTVTERLQQILQTVRRDPGKAELVRIDLNHLVRELHAAWTDLAREKWKLVLELDVQDEPLWIEGDMSHLQQALENLLFNARDATFEMRNHLREQARRTSPLSPMGRGAGGEGLPPSDSPRPLMGRGVGGEGLPPSDSPRPLMGRGVGGEGLPHAEMKSSVPDSNQPPGVGPPLTPNPSSQGGEGGKGLPPERRQALIAAAAWKGRVVLATRRAGDRAVVEVRDNGIGMTDEVRRRCTETHFSTKRDNALFAGLSAGMGLGLSFVQVILQHHRATLEIDSRPFEGAVFRVGFPSA